MTKGRYLAVIKRTPDADRISAAGEAATGLARVVNEGDFTLFVDRFDVEGLRSGAHGALVGQLFQRASARSDKTSDIVHAAYLSHGQSVIDNHWGAYVLFLNYPGAIEVIRDPGGRLPCYFTETDSGVVIASDVDTLVDAGVVKARVDWDACALHLGSADLPLTRTAIAGVMELLPGFRLRVLRTTWETDQAWSPWDFVDPDPDETEGNSAEMLFHTIVDCSAALAEAFDDVLLRVSGGLDSSIVASALNERSVSCRLMTLVAGDGDGDERLYARSVAHVLQMELAERSYGVAQVDIRQPSSPHLPRPRGRCIGQAIAKLCDQELSGVRNAAVFTGFGGDNVFCFLHSIKPLVDRIRSEGAGAGAAETLHNICRLTGSSYPEAIGRVLKGLRNGSPAFRWRANDTLLVADHSPAISRALHHPWLVPPTGALPGKAAHIAMILGALNHVEEMTRSSGFPEVAPLLSQPVMELCLRIPSWIWCSAGRDRSLARSAFSTHLPNMVINRRSKGGPDAFCSALLDANRTAIREYLVGGLLAQNRVINGPAIDAILDKAHLIPSDIVLRVLQLTDAEAWARSWSSQ